jgi:hypothetical protein
MSFRQDSRKGKDAPKMTVRDMRLFMAVSAHEKLEQQQESMADDYEGSRSKTPTKRNSAARKSTGKVDIYQKEENDRNQRVKKRLKKMREKKSNFVRNWKTHGVLRNTHGQLIHLILERFRIMKVLKLRMLLRCIDYILVRNIEIDL